MYDIMSRHMAAAISYGSVPVGTVPYDVLYDMNTVPYTSELVPFSVRSKVEHPKVIGL